MVDFSEQDVNILLVALHNHAIKRRCTMREAYDLQVKLLHLVGKEMPITFEEAQQIAREAMRG